MPRMLSSKGLAAPTQRSLISIKPFLLCLSLLPMCYLKFWLFWSLLLVFYLCICLLIIIVIWIDDASGNFPLNLVIWYGIFNPQPFLWTSEEKVYTYVVLCWGMLATFSLSYFLFSLSSSNYYLGLISQNKLPGYRPIFFRTILLAHHHGWWKTVKVLAQ